MNVSDEVLDTASKVFCHTYYRPNSVNDGLRAALEAVLPMLRVTPDSVTAFILTDTTIENMAKAAWEHFNEQHYENWRTAESRDSYRRMAHRVLSLLAPKTDEERLRVASALCEACLPGAHDILRAKELIDDALVFLVKSPPRKMMRLVYQVMTYDGGYLAWYDLPDGTCEMRLFKAGQEVPKEIEVPE